MVAFARILSSLFLYVLLTIQLNADVNHKKFSSLEDTPYPQRYQQIQFLGNHFPGKRIGYDIVTKKKLGLFSGIYQQTIWQVRSGRNKVSLWNIVNAYLSTEVNIFAQHYIKNQECHSFKSLQKKRCLAWLPYFKMHKNKKPLLSTKSMQRLMWKAHTITVKTILSEYNFHAYKDFNHSEFLFWRGWIRIVYKLEKLNYPTIGFFVSPVVKKYMPNCSLLDSQGCKIKEFSFRRRLFIKGLQNGKLDLLMDILSLKIFK